MTRSDLFEREVWGRFLDEHWKRHQHVLTVKPGSAEGAPRYRALWQELATAGVTYEDLSAASRRLVVRGTDERRHFALLYDLAIGFRDRRLSSEPRRRDELLDFTLERASRTWAQLDAAERAARIEDARRRFPALDRQETFLRELVIREMAAELAQEGVTHATA